MRYIIYFPHNQTFNGACRGFNLTLVAQTIGRRQPSGKVKLIADTRLKIDSPFGVTAASVR